MNGLLFVYLAFIICYLNAEITWNKIDEALPLAKSSGSPILLLSVRKDCKPCKKLLEQLTASSEFADQSKKFVLAKAEDGEITKLGSYKTEGKYVPKIVFINTNGVLMKDLDNKNKKNEKTRYFYKKVDDVLISMTVALDHQYLDNGFGKDYVWYDWESGLVAAKEQNKPILVIFHQDWCGACKRLKPIFADSAEVKEVASKFIMINTDNEDVVKGDKYQADGEYYPKMLFLDSDGDHIKEEINYGTKHKHVLHYYGVGLEIRQSMDRILGNITEMENVKDNGFGKHIRWVSYEKGLKLSKEQKKPMMLIITKTYCGACKALKPKIRNDKELAAVSKKFIMVNVDDDNEPDEDQFDIDGAYIPRIFFLDANGKVEKSIYNELKGYKKSKYAYGTPKQIVDVMNKALEMKLGERTEEQQQTTQEETKQTPKKETKTDDEKKTAEETAKNDGFASNIKWYSYKEGLQEAKKSHKIGLVVIYNNYCMFSHFLKEQFKDSPQITGLSEKFVMIKVSEEESKEYKDKYDVDGTYTPRMFFIDPDQNVHKEINNTGTNYDKTMFYYGTAKEIVVAMNVALETINTTLGNGFGEYIQWVKYGKALEVIKEKQMPMMLIIHKTWCGACKSLKPTIKDSRPIWELSKYFIMVNVEDAEEPIDNDYFIDGGYYPRIYFLDSNGKVQHDLHNRDPAFLKYKYSYAYEDQILHSMKFAVGKFNIAQEQQQQETTETTSDTTTATNDKQDIMLSPGKKLLANSGLDWKSIGVALKESAESKKPIMFLVHRTTCPACKATIKVISRDEDFKEKSKDFILADIEDDVDDVLADSFDVDGTYVPRIYFLDPEGQIFKEIWNVGTNYLDNKFYFFEASSIYRAMEKTKRKMLTWSPGSNNSAKPKEEKKTEEKKDEPKEEKKDEPKEEKKDEQKEEKKDEPKEEKKDEQKEEQKKEDEIKKDEL